MQIITPALHLSSQMLLWHLHNLEAACPAQPPSGGSSADGAAAAAAAAATPLTPQVRNEIRLLAQRVQELVQCCAQLLRSEHKEVMYEVCCPLPPPLNLPLNLPMQPISLVSFRGLADCDSVSYRTPL